MGSQPKATLLTFTPYSVETLYCLWIATRTTGPVPLPEEMVAQCNDSADCRREVSGVFGMLTDAESPLLRNLDATFVLENVPFPLREQIIQHRLASRLGDAYTVDQFADDQQSFAMSQTMRFDTVDNFYDQGNCYLPKTVAEATVELDQGIKTSGAQLFGSAMFAFERAYRSLLAVGVPPEDARYVLPLAVTSRLTWKVDFATLRAIMRQRGCWLQELGPWKPLLLDMVNQLGSRVHPSFRRLIDPPCFNRGSFQACPFGAENMERVKGFPEDSDPVPSLAPCPLFLNFHGDQVEKIKPAERIVFRSRATWDFEDPKIRSAFQAAFVEFEQLWCRNPWNGQPIY